jgi:predicted helicase
VTNNGYLDAVNADGVRAHLGRDFDGIYLVDLGGNVRKNPKLSGTTHNVFGIQVGVSIALFVRHKQRELKNRQATIRYAAVGEDWRKERKWKWLEKKRSIAEVKWQTLKPDGRNTWLREGLDEDFDTFMAIGNKETKATDSIDAHAIFRTYSLGVSTNRDSVVYDFDSERLAKRVEAFCEDYNAEVSRWVRKGRPEDIDNYVQIQRVKWSRDLKEELKAEKFLLFDKGLIRPALYRPFTVHQLYRAPGIVDRIGDDYFPTLQSDAENRVLALTGVAPDKPFMAMTVAAICDLHFCSAGVGTQCFPLYTYADDGTHRRDNITDWSLEQFKARYPGVKLTKRDIFHYVYAILHHPAYREKYAANLRRELPRIPFAADFISFAKAGEKLAALHTGYETQREFALTRVEAKGVKPNWRVERMKLSKDKSALIYNDWLTLTGIPAVVHEYRLGNRSALEWVVDQYRVDRAKDNPDEILSDPNRVDDEEYIVRLVGQVVAVSIETMKVIAGLPALDAGSPVVNASAVPAEYPMQSELDAAHVYFAKEEPPVAN